MGPLPSVTAAIAAASGVPTPAPGEGLWLATSGRRVLVVDDEANDSWVSVCTATREERVLPCSTITRLAQGSLYDLLDLLWSIPAEGDLDE